MSWSVRESRDHQVVINYKAEGTWLADVCKFVSESEEKGGDAGDTHLTPGENLCFLLLNSSSPWCGDKSCSI